MPSLSSSHRFTTFLLLGVAIVPSLAFTFLQTHDSYHSESISEKQFLAAPFAQLCPSGNCIDDCRNRARIFQAVPDGVEATVQDYGQPDKSGKVNITVFGLCTNLVSAHKLVKADGSEMVKSFFTLPSHMNAVTDPFKQVALDIAACLSDTCSRTRDPSRCMTVCSMRHLLNNNTDTFDWRDAMLNCTRKLCRPSDVLPYANQDVLGIGVLISYYIQGALLLVAAAGVIASLAWQLWKGQDNKPKITQKLKDPMATFLTAQTYFSISAAIAAFILRPSSVDPLNAYTLMVVATVGFLGPVFTLLLLRSHNVRTGFGTSLTFVSWLLNTVIFFLLLRNLSAFSETVSEDALNQLFKVPICGGSSAMTLCHQVTGSNPLQSLTGFFERGSWTNIRTVPMLWAWTTITLFVLIPEELWQAVRLRRKEKAAAQQAVINTKMGQNAAQHPESRLDARYLALGKFVAVTFLIVLFSVSLGYCSHMVMRFRDVGVIDTHGWSFGQVVAALFWIPVFLDVAHSVFVEEKRHGANSSVSSQEGSEMKLTPSMNRSVYSPLPESSLTNPENEDRSGHSQPTASPTFGPQKRSVHKRQTLRIEEGQ